MVKELLRSEDHAFARLATKLDLECQHHKALVNRQLRRMGWDTASNGWINLGGTQKKIKSRRF